MFEKFLCCTECGSRNLEMGMEEETKRNGSIIYPFRYCRDCGGKFIDPEGALQRISILQEWGRNKFKRVSAVASPVIAFAVYMLTILLVDKITGVIITAALAFSAIAAIIIAAIYKRAKYAAARKLQAKVADTVMRIHNVKQKN